MTRLKQSYGEHKSATSFKKSSGEHKYGFKKSYREFSITHNRFRSLLDKHTPCEPATLDNLVKFLQCSMWVRNLVRRDDSMVNINSLRGKIVGLFFMSPATVVNKRAMLQCILDIATAYNELSKSKKGQFEIVWIANVDDYLQYKEYLIMMPWLAIPFKETTGTRNFLCSLAEIDREQSFGYELFLYDREGKLSIDGAATLLSIYGADWYPFTYERINEIAIEDGAIEKNKSLKNLLGSATRDFVLRNDGSQVSISELENKVVGIYFCNTDITLRSCFTRKLLDVYSQLQKKGKQFEIVMVHTGGWCLDKYLEPDFKSMPWYLLPRVDSTYNRMVRIFYSEHDMDNCLVIVGQHGSFVNKFGYSAINIYGIEAYPFSRLSVVEIEKKKLEVLVKSLLTCGDENYVIRKSGEKMPISYLLGKTIVLLLADVCSSRSNKDGLASDRIKWYTEIKENHASEVILAAAGFDKSSFDEYYGQMPWLAFPHNDTRVETLCLALKLRCPKLAVFGPNAQLLSMNPESWFYRKGAKSCPFSGKDALMDMYDVVSEWFNWPLNYDDMHF